SLTFAQTRSLVATSSVSTFLQRKKKHFGSPATELKRYASKCACTSLSDIYNWQYLRDLLILPCTAVFHELSSISPAGSWPRRSIGNSYVVCGLLLLAPFAWYF